MAVVINTQGGTATPSTANPSLILAESGLLNALYQEAGTAIQATGTAAALNTEAQGTEAEAGEYTTAADISQQNAQIAQLSGTLEEYQNTRTLMNTLGTQAADISGAGFGESGSAIYLARSSLQQGLLQNQVLGQNAELTSGGYLEQAQASTTEATAATTAANTELSQASTATQLAALAKAQETTTSNFLEGLPGVSVSPGANGIPTVTNPGVTGTSTMNGGMTVI